MATLQLTPTSLTIVEGGVFVPPSITAIADDGTTDVSSTVTGPVPSPDTNLVGTQNLVYTLPADGTNVATEITKTFKLIVTANPTNTEKFINGSQDRYGNDTTGTTYESAVQNPPADEFLSGLFDENSIDPYESAHANKNK